MPRAAVLTKSLNNIKENVKPISDVLTESNKIFVIDIENTGTYTVKTNL